MEKFIMVKSIATPFPRANVDTDIIIPAKCLKSVKRTGFASEAFESVRFDRQGNLINDNPFDNERYRGSKILIAGDNFGCGSSREHAVWAIKEMGFLCIIAPSFADIFSGNCVKNGILTVLLPHGQVDTLARAAQKGHEISVDLSEQTVQCQNDLYRFEYNPIHKEMLLNGIDEVGQTLRSISMIKSHEEKQRTITPWLFR